MSTFNGWNVITLPSSPAPRSIEWSLNDTVGSVRSPFSLQQQISNWGASILRGSVSLPPMQKGLARPFVAFLAAAQGIASVFSIGDPVSTGPANPGATAGTVTGSGQTGYVLDTSSSGLLPGDWFSLGLRLYMVTSVSGGILGVWPQIRESPAGGTPLVITNTQGLFRLTKNERKFTQSVGGIYSITFEIEEAL